MLDMNEYVKEINGIMKILVLRSSSLQKYNRKVNAKSERRKAGIDRYMRKKKRNAIEFTINNKIRSGMR